MPYIAQLLALLEAAVKDGELGPHRPECIKTRWRLPDNFHKLDRWADTGDFPEFPRLAGVTCAEWRRHAVRAMFIGIPILLPEHCLRVNGSFCIIRHCINPFGKGGLLGTIQYYPKRYMRLSPDELISILGNLRTGLYSLDSDCSFTGKETAMAVVIRPLYLSHDIPKRRGNDDTSQVY